MWLKGWLMNEHSQVERSQRILVWLRQKVNKQHAAGELIDLLATLEHIAESHDYRPLEQAYAKESFDRLFKNIVWVEVRCLDCAKPYTEVDLRWARNLVPECDREASEETVPEFVYDSQCPLCRGEEEHSLEVNGDACDPV